MKPKLIISACLLGVHCRYDGGESVIPELTQLLERCELIPVCPEQLGGLPTPRVPAECSGTRVRTQSGCDVTTEFERGAQEVASLSQRLGIRFALLKERSPSCGIGVIYDGSFTGTRVRGDGVTARLLKSQGVRVFGETDIEGLLAALATNVSEAPADVRQHT